MSTGAKIDSSLSGGLSGLRMHMEKMRNTIKEVNEKADSMEKEKEGAYNTMRRIVGKQQAIKQKITKTEDEIEKSEKKVKETEVRLQEKEQFLKESKEFTRSLKIINPNEGAVEKKVSEVTTYKDMYHKNYEVTHLFSNISIFLSLQTMLLFHTPFQ